MRFEFQFEVEERTKTNHGAHNIEHKCQCSPNCLLPTPLNLGGGCSLRLFCQGAREHPLLQEFICSRPDEALDSTTFRPNPNPHTQPHSRSTAERHCRTARTAAFCTGQIRTLVQIANTQYCRATANAIEEGQDRSVIIIFFLRIPGVWNLEAKVLLPGIKTRSTATTIPL